MSASNQTSTSLKSAVRKDLWVRTPLPENSVARSRVIVSGVQVGARLLEVGEMEERLASVEAALGPRVVERKRR